MTHTIDLYHPADLPALALCWNDAFGEAWHTSPDLLNIMLSADGSCIARDHFVARVDGQIVGAVITQTQRESERTPHPSGSIAALYVRRDQQRRGIGRDLLSTAIDYLRGIGIRRVVLGGRVPRLFPGIPTNLPAALDFFRTQGWTGEKHVYDLVRDVSEYVTPKTISARLAADKVSILPAASPAEAADALTMQAAEFPGWYDEFAYPIRVGDYRDVLIAREGDGTVVGTLLMCSPDAHPTRGETIWRSVLGAGMVGMNAVGVTKTGRGRGIGLALVARGSAILRSRGARNVLIGWTDLVDFYGKLGYKAWREYLAVSGAV